MFCGNCGNRIKENARFCANCGNPVEGLPSRAADLPIIIEKKADSKWGDVFKKGWRTFFGSPLVLITNICYTLGLILNILSLDSVKPLLENYGLNADELSTLMNNITMMVAIPGALMAIGLWSLYFGAKSPMKKRISTVGITIIMNVSLFCEIMLIAVLLMPVGVIDPLEHQTSGVGRGGYHGLFGDTKTALIVVQLIGYSIVGLVYRALYMMRKTAKESTPAGMYSAIGLGVLLVVLGVLSLAGLMNEGFTLAVLVNCVATVLLGVTVFMYCGAMKKLQRIWNLDYANRKSDFFTPDRGTTSTNVILDGQTSAPTNEYIPTWKRIQMEHGQQTHVERPYVKAAVTVKICPECGTTQSADNHECICCGATM